VLLVGEILTAAQQQPTGFFQDGIAAFALHAAGSSART
jgi:hypothetical protein